MTSLDPPSPPTLWWQSVGLEAAPRLAPAPGGPLPSETMAPGAGQTDPCLPANALRRLLVDADLLAVTAQDQAHPYPETVGDRLLSAAAGHWLAPHIGLDRAFWAEPHALWRGQVATGLAELIRQFRQPLPGFVCIHAQEAGPWGLSWQTHSPLATADELTGDMAVGGPYRVLLRCELDWTGTVSVRSGYAQPVYSMVLPLPMTRRLERDIMTLLLKVQDLGDTAGQDITIARQFQAGQLGPLQLLVSDQAGRQRVIGAITCETTLNNGAQGGLPTPAAARRTTAKCLETGAFQAWLAALAWKDPGL